MLCLLSDCVNGGLPALSSSDVDLSWTHLRGFQYRQSPILIVHLRRLMGLSGLPSLAAPNFCRAQCQVHSPGVRVGFVLDELLTSSNRSNFLTNTASISSYRRNRSYPRSPPPQLWASYRQSNTKCAYYLQSLLAGIFYPANR